MEVGGFFTKIKVKIWSYRSKIKNFFAVYARSQFLHTHIIVSAILKAIIRMYAQ